MLENIDFIISQFAKFKDLNATEFIVNSFTNNLWGLLLIAITLFLTRNRKTLIKGFASNKLIPYISYLITTQIIGLVIGKIFFDMPISFHLPGTIYGTYFILTPAFVATWVTYNFMSYVAIPFVYFFKIKKYNTSLFKSSNIRSDILLLLVILILESAAEIMFLKTDLFSHGHLNGIIPIIISGLINFFGTVLPTMVSLYVILISLFIDRGYSKLRITLLLGFAYAAVHTFESWTNYTTLGFGVTSFVMILLQYFVPGMIKAVITLRSGNAWIHALSYHLVAPHMIIDADLFRK